MRKKITTACLTALSLLALSQQKDPVKVGKASDYLSLITQQTQSHSEETLPIYTNGRNQLSGIINLVQKSENETIYIGGDENGSGNVQFSVSLQGEINGQYTSLTNKVAYRYFTDAKGDLYAEEQDINKVMCVDMYKTPAEETETAEDDGVAEAQPDLQSLPGCPYVIYIDMDGEVSTSQWNNGQTINAQSMGFTQAQMAQVWELVAEDFKPFNVNVTTNRAIYDATPNSRRMMCICTTTNTAAPGAGGVAYIGSFSWNQNVPCWTFNTGVKQCAETTSHEIGHTLGLNHDGTSGGQGYYGGHANWAPIMGNSMQRAVTHWSKGEYSGANNTEDDLNIITTTNGFGYRNDDVGNTTATAGELTVQPTGQINKNDNSWIIERNTDIDMFRIDITSTGNVNLVADPHPTYPNLNIRARLYDASGSLLYTESPTNTLSATISQTLQAGTYYLAIDGVGDGANAVSGYSNYNSMGMYTISGTIPPPVPKPFAAFKANQTQSCGPMTVNFTDHSSNTPTSWLWTFEGGTPSTSTQQNPSVQYATPGKYAVTLKVVNSHGETTLTEQEYINIIDRSGPNVSDVSVCTAGTTVVLSTSASDGEINWYTSQNSNTPVHTGSQYTYQVAQNQTFFIDVTTHLDVFNVPNNVGHTSPSVGGGANHAGGFYLIFDAEKSFLLKSATVQAQGAKNRTLQLRDASGTVLTEKTIYIASGLQTIDIDLEIPAGNDLQIGFAQGADLFRNDQGVTYPYTLDGVVSIKNSTAGDPGYYYYLYNWEIHTQGTCKSERSTINVSIEKPDAPTVADVVLCNGPEEVTFEAIVETNQKAQWYNSANTTAQPIAVGNQFSTLVTQDISYWVVAVEGANSQFGGHTSPSVGDGANHNGGHYLILSVNEPLIFKSALVRAQGAKNRTLQLRNSSGTVIQEKTVFIPNGESRVVFDLELPAENNLQLGFAVNDCDLFRSGQGVTFPYEIPGLLTITSSTAADQGDYYYYFYNIEVQALSGCISEPAEVKAKMDICTSLSNATLADLVTAYPTHFHQDIHLTTPNGNSEISIIDSKGTECFHTQVQGEKHNLNLANLPQGMFFLLLKNNGDYHTLKIVKD